MSDTEPNNETKNEGQAPQPKDRTVPIVLASVLVVVIVAVGVLLWKTNVLKKGPKPLTVFSGSGPGIIVGNVTITKEQLNKQMNLQISLLKQFFATQGKPFDPYSKASAQMINQIKQSVIQGDISLTLLQGYATGKGITVSDTEVSQVFDSLQARLGKPRFDKIVKESGMSVDEIKQQVKDQLIAKAVYTDVQKNLKISDADAKAFYEKHKNLPGAPGQMSINQQPEVDARHILVKTQQEAEQIEKELKAGQPFTVLAREKSIDKGTAVRGGDLGFFTANQMVPAFSQAAFALKKPGDISKPIHTQFGWHVIQLIAKKPGHVRTFAEVKPQIEQMLARQQASTAMEKLINDLKGKTKVEIEVK